MSTEAQKALPVPGAKVVVISGVEGGEEVDADHWEAGRGGGKQASLPDSPPSGTSCYWSSAGLGCRPKGGQCRFPRGHYPIHSPLTGCRRCLPQRGHAGERASFNPLALPPPDAQRSMGLHPPSSNLPQQRLLGKGVIPPYATGS